jgi:hypothetical protein
VNATLERALAAAGDPGPEIRARVQAGGLLFPAKRRGRGVELPDVRAALGEPRLDKHDWPAPGHVGRFTPDRVWIEDANGAVVAERDEPRKAIRRASKLLRWDDLDFLYFSGYALWNYLTTPWLLTRVELRERGGGRLDATFPPEIPTHSRRQSFWFSDDGLLLRHDYTAEVVFPGAASTHRCFDHARVSGVVMPTRRRVTPRYAPGPTLVSLAIS